MADIQSKQRSSQGIFFKIVSYEKLVNCKLFKNIKLGIDPSLFTSSQVSNFFLKFNNVKNRNKFN